MRLANLSIFPGIPEELGIRFTKRELETLQRAAKLAEKARELLRKELGQVEADDLDLDTTLAGIEHGVSEFVAKHEERDGYPI